MTRKKLTEVKDEKKWNGEVLTLYTDLKSLVNEVEQGLKGRGFSVHYTSEIAMYGERDFQFNFPFLRSGTIEWAFFEYSDHITVSYRVRPSWGLSVLTAFLLVNSLGISLAANFGDSGSYTMYMITTFLALLLGYQKYSTVIFLKKMAMDLLRKFQS